MSLYQEGKEARPEGLVLEPGSLRMRVVSHSKWRYFLPITLDVSEKAKYMPQPDSLWHIKFQKV